MRFLLPVALGCGGLLLSLLLHPLLSQGSLEASVPVAPEPSDYDMVPDLIRLRTPMPASALKCGELLPPESAVTTRHDDTTAVAIYAFSTFLGAQQDDEGQAWRHSWEFHVELHNVGSTTVQLMTQHTVTTTVTGTIEEVKLPGALGKVPLIAPGDSFRARGKTQLPTAYGALHGSYQFEAVSDSNGATMLGAGRAFSANMGRLLLSGGGKAQRVPCVPEADVMARVLPTTSVYNSYRVLTGATVTYMPSLSEADLYQYVYMYEVQLQNARDKPIVVHGREWTFLDARGVTHTEQGAGLGGTQQTGKVRIPAGRGTRHQGTFQLPTTTGMAAARFVMTLDEADPHHTTYDVLVAPMGVSTDGQAVPPIEPARFLLDV